MSGGKRKRYGGPEDTPKRPSFPPVTRDRYEKAKAWATENRDLLLAHSCCSRVFLVVATLMEDENEYVHGPALSAALSTKRVVTTALDLLDEIGVDCDDCERVGHQAG